MSADGSTASNVTALLDRLNAGDGEALDRLFPLIYEELQLLARRQRRRWEGDYTMNTTALVHEAYLKLVGRHTVGARGRGHFFALASRAMRHILCNYGRDRQAQKRGGGAVVLSLDGEAGAGVPLPDPDPGRALLESLDQGLNALERVHPRPARVVECRFFGGLTVEETAAALDVSPRTVKRDWRFAQAWLKNALEGS
jgi:RNA polymerase sigma factor (TIGR02999 family)